jgi:hypothetical protein
VGGERRWREEVERKKKKKKNKKIKIRLWRFSCGDLSVSVAALNQIYYLVNYIFNNNFKIHVII